MDAPLVEMTFTLEKSDYSRAVQLSGLRTSGKRLRELGVAGLIVLPVLIYGLVAERRFFAIVLAGLVLLPMLVLFALSRALARQGARQADQPVTGRPLTWPFGPEEVEAVSGERRERGSWSQWIGFVEMGDYFFLYSTPEVCNILPKRGLASPEEVERLHQLILSKLPPKRL